MQPRTFLSPTFVFFVLAMLGSARAQQPQPVLVHLEIPVYPPLAQQADISGSVQLELTIAPEGTVKSWKAISGHPILVRAATDTLEKARFKCDGCGQEPYNYTLTYEFILPADRFAKACEEVHKTGKEPAMPPSTQDSPTRVTVRPLHSGCVVRDPLTRRGRSARCLWLWRCAIG